MISNYQVVGYKCINPHNGCLVTVVNSALIPITRNGQSIAIPFGYDLRMIDTLPKAIKTAIDDRIVKQKEWFPSNNLQLYGYSFVYFKNCLIPAVDVSKGEIASFDCMREYNIDINTIEKYMREFNLGGACIEVGIVNPDNMDLSNIDIEDYLRVHYLPEYEKYGFEFISFDPDRDTMTLITNALKLPQNKPKDDHRINMDYIVYVSEHEVAGIHYHRVHMSKTEINPESYGCKLFTARVDLRQVYDIWDALTTKGLHVPFYVADYITRILTRNPKDYETVVYIDSLEIDARDNFDPMPDLFYTIKSYDNKYEYALYSAAIPLILNDAGDVPILYDVAILGGDMEDPGNIDYKGWLYENYVPVYTKLGFVDLNDTCIGYDSRIIMGYNVDKDKLEIEYCAPRYLQPEEQDSINDINDLDDIVADEIVRIDSEKDEIYKEAIKEVHESYIPDTSMPTDVICQINKTRYDDHVNITNHKNRYHLNQLYMCGYIVTDPFYHGDTVRFVSTPNYSHTRTSVDVDTALHDFAEECGIVTRQDPDECMRHETITIPRCQLCIYYTPTKTTLDEATTAFLSKLEGVVGAFNYDVEDVGYSEYTITGYNINEMTLGGHDIKRQLMNNRGKYCHFILTYRGGE